MLTDHWLRQIGSQSHAFHLPSGTVADRWSMKRRLQERDCSDDKAKPLSKRPKRQRITNEPKLYRKTRHNTRTRQILA